LKVNSASQITFYECIKWLGYWSRSIAAEQNAVITRAAKLIEGA